MAEARRVEYLKRAEMFQMRRKEREIAAEERRQAAKEKLEQEMAYKTDVREEREKSEQARSLSIRRKEDESSGGERKSLGQTAPRSYPGMAPTEPLSVAHARTVKPVSETLQPEIEAIQTSHSISAPDSGSDSLSHSTTTVPSSELEKLKLSVDVLTPARVQVLKERAGDYFRYLPYHFGLRGRKVMAGPTAYAQLILARRRGASLTERRQAIQVVERFVGMRG